jgi:hypothetical protein
MLDEPPLIVRRDNGLFMKTQVRNFELADSQKRVNVLVMVDD